MGLEPRTQRALGQLGAAVETLVPQRFHGISSARDRQFGAAVNWSKSGVGCPESLHRGAA
jgi:hypothetical protein